MARQRHEDEDDDDHRILRDGEFLHVPMMMMDGSPNRDLTSVQRAVALDSQQRDEAAALRFNLNDAAALHRPGYRFSINDAALDAKEQAYRDVDLAPVSYTHLRAHETRHDLVCRLLLEK